MCLLTVFFANVSEKLYQNPTIIKSVQCRPHRGYPAERMTNWPRGGLRLRETARARTPSPAHDDQLHCRRRRRRRRRHRCKFRIQSHGGGAASAEKRAEGDDDNGDERGVSSAPLLNLHPHRRLRRRQDQEGRFLSPFSGFPRIFHTKQLAKSNR